MRPIYLNVVIVAMLFLFGWLFMLPERVQPMLAMAQTSQPSPVRTLVIIVPGMTGNADFWPDVVGGKATFASELKRAAGSGTEIYPYLWNGSFDHASREAAAKALASIIDAKSASFDRVCLVGHSFGGDIALRAAGLCQTKIDIAVCLATPHTYLTMQNANRSQDFVPVYCTWESRQNIKAIVNVYPRNDTGVVNQANEYKNLELSEADAIPLTQSWQEHLEFPRLVNDSLEAHYYRLERNLVLVEPLNVADLNVAMQSFVMPGPRFAEHSAIHSRRMGYVIGELLQHGLTQESAIYLSTKIEAKNADSGEPVPEAAQEAFETSNLAGFRHLGWRLDRISVDLLPQTIRIANNFNGTLPSPFINVLSGGNGGRSQTFSTPPALHTLHTVWNTDFILWNGMESYLSLRAHHDLVAPTDLGGIALTGNETPPPSAITANPSGQAYWSATLSWVSIHY